MQQQGRGFTLVELMIVVTILGVIMALALPTYGRYVARSQASRVVSELAHLRARVEECVTQGLTVVGNGGGQCDMSHFSTDLVSGLITDLQVGDTRISAQLGDNASASIRGRAVRWQRNADGIWVCYSDLESGFRPDACQHG